MNFKIQLVQVVTYFGIAVFLFLGIPGVYCAASCATVQILGEQYSCTEGRWSSIAKVPLTAVVLGQDLQTLVATPVLLMQKVVLLTNQSYAYEGCAVGGLISCLLKKPGHYRHFEPDNINVEDGVFNVGQETKGNEGLVLELARSIARGELDGSLIESVLEVRVEREPRNTVDIYLRLRPGHLPRLGRAAIGIYNHHKTLQLTNKVKLVLLVTDVSNPRFHGKVLFNANFPMQDDPPFITFRLGTHDLEPENLAAPVIALSPSPKTPEDNDKDGN